MLKKIVMLGVLTSVGFSANAFASNGEFYWLPRIGAAVFDTQSYFSDEPMTQVGLVYGYGLFANLAIEVEGSMSIGGGRYSTSAGAGKYKGSMLGAFGVGRYPIADQNIYLKAKLGGVYQNIKHTTPGTQVADERITDFVMQAGLGFGYQFDSGISAELEYVRGGSSFDQFLFGVNYMY